MRSGVYIEVGSGRKWYQDGLVVRIVPPQIHVATMHQGGAYGDISKASIVFSFSSRRHVCQSQHNEVRPPETRESCPTTKQHHLGPVHQFLRMAPILESTDVKNKLEDLSGVVIKPGENPYNALIETCGNDPVSHSTASRSGLVGKSFWEPCRKWRAKGDQCNDTVNHAKARLCYCSMAGKT